MNYVGSELWGWCAYYCC